MHAATTPCATSCPRRRRGVQLRRRRGGVAAQAQAAHRPGRGPAALHATGRRQGRGRRALGRAVRAVRGRGPARHRSSARRLRHCRQGDARRPARRAGARSTVLDGRYDSALATRRRDRALQDKPADKLRRGLAPEGDGARRQGGTGRPATPTGAPSPRRRSASSRRCRYAVDRERRQARQGERRADRRDARARPGARGAAADRRRAAARSAPTSRRRSSTRASRCVDVLPLKATLVDAYARLPRGAPGRQGRHLGGARRRAAGRRRSARRSSIAIWDSGVDTRALSASQVVRDGGTAGA